MAAIENAWMADTDVQRRRSVPVKVFLRPYRGERIERDFIGEDSGRAGAGDHRILLSDADTLNRMQNMAGSVNRYIDVPQTVSLLQSGADQQSAVRFDWWTALRRSITTIRRCRACRRSVLNVMQAGRGVKPGDGDHAGNGDRADVDSVRLHGDGQLFAAHPCEVTANYIGGLNKPGANEDTYPVAGRVQRVVWWPDPYLDAGRSRRFREGESKNLSLRSDGRLTLAPATRELFDTSSSYLWALAQDSKGNLYAGGGTSAKVYRITPDGKGKLLADLDALEIHAIAVDSKDRVYAATSPDGKVYRITGNGKPEVFYDPKAKYIWALAFDAAGNLFVATGDQGELHRVTPDGKGSVFFKTDETHVRSLAIEAKGNLIVGTEPGGLSRPSRSSAPSAGTRPIGVSCAVGLRPPAARRSTSAPGCSRRSPARRTCRSRPCGTS